MSEKKIDDKVNKKTRVRNIVFTLNNYKDGDIDIIKSFDWIRYGIVGEEVAPTSGTPHYQGYLQLKSQKTFSSILKCFHKKGLKPHVEKAMGTLQQNQEYCEGITSKKKKNEVVHEWGTVKEQGKRSDLDKLYEMIKEGKDNWDIAEEFPSQVIQYKKSIDSLRQEWIMKKQKKLMKELCEQIKLRAWQLTALDRLNRQNDRQILWIYDEHGNSGKTVLAKYLMDKFDAFYVQNGKQGDIAYSYNYEEYVVFDYVRSQRDFINYGVLESFKNGLIFSPKYQSVTKRFMPCKVIVMANFLPDKKHLSLDRWDIMEIEGEDIYEYGKKKKNEKYIDFS